MSKYSNMIMRTPSAVSYWRFGDPEGSVLAVDALGLNPFFNIPGTSFGMIFGINGLLTNDPGTAAHTAGELGVTNVAIPAGVDFTGLEQFTLEGFIVATNTIGSTPLRMFSKAMIDPMTGEYGGYELYLRSTGITLVRYGVGRSDQITGSTTLMVGPLNLIHGTFDGKYVRIYLNGRIVGSPVASTVSVASSPAPFQLGDTGGRQSQATNPRFSASVAGAGFNGWEIVGTITRRREDLGSGGFPAAEGGMPAELSTGANIITRAEASYTWSYFMLVAGVTYTISIWQYISSKTATDLRMRVTRTRDGVQTGSDAIWTSTGAWSRRSITFTPPTTEQYLVRLLQNGAGEINWYATGLLIERSATMNTYFDASSANAYQVGTAGALGGSAQQYSTENALSCHVQEGAVYSSALSAREIEERWKLARGIFPDPQRIRQYGRLTMESR